MVINQAKFHDRGDPIDESRSCEGRLEPGEQSRGILPLQDDPHQYLVGVTLDLLGRRMQLYRRAVAGAVGGRESGYQVALLAEIIEQLLAKRASGDQRQAYGFAHWAPFATLPKRR